MVLILKSNNPVCNFWNNCPYFAFLANVDKNYNLSKDLTFSIELALNLSTMKSDTLKTKQEVLSHMPFFQNFHYDINMYIYLRLFDIILTYNWDIWKEIVGYSYRYKPNMLVSSKNPFPDILGC